MFKDRSTVNHAMRKTEYEDLYTITELKEYRRLCKCLAYHGFYYVKKRFSINHDAESISKIWEVKVLASPTKSIENIFK